MKADHELLNSGDNIITAAKREVVWTGSRRKGRPEITVVYKDVDEITMERKGTQTTVISLPVEVALKLLAAGTVRVGWAMEAGGTEAML